MNTGVHAIDAAREALERDGYCFMRGAVAPALIAECRDAFARWTDENAAACAAERAKYDGLLPRIVNLHEHVPALGRLFSETPSVLAFLDAYFAAEAVLYTSIYFEHGSGQNVHRDAPYFATVPRLNRFLGVWYALEDAGSTNGPLTAVRGGHAVDVDGVAVAAKLFPDLNEVRPIDPALWQAYQDAVVAACSGAGLETHELHARAGDVIVWQALLPHGGMPVASGSPTRHSLVVHTIPVHSSVHQMDVFFNAQHGVKADTYRHYTYDALSGGRHAVRHAGPYFGTRPLENPKASTAGG